MKKLFLRGVIVTLIAVTTIIVLPFNLYAGGDGLNATIDYAVAPLGIDQNGEPGEGMHGVWASVLLHNNTAHSVQILQPTGNVTEAISVNHLGQSENNAPPEIIRLYPVIQPYSTQSIAIISLELQSGAYSINYDRTIRLGHQLPDGEQFVDAQVAADTMISVDASNCESLEALQRTVNNVNENVVSTQAAVGDVREKVGSSYDSLNGHLNQQDRLLNSIKNYVLRIWQILSQRRS